MAQKYVGLDLGTHEVKAVLLSAGLLALDNHGPFWPPMIGALIVYAVAQTLEFHGSEGQTAPVSVKTNPAWPQAAPAKHAVEPGQGWPSLPNHLAHGLCPASTPSVGWATRSNARPKPASTRETTKSVENTSSVDVCHTRPSKPFAGAAPQRNAVFADSGLAIVDDFL